MLFVYFNFILIYFWCLCCFFFVFPNVLRLWFYYIFCCILCIMCFFHLFYNKSIFWYQYMLVFYKFLFFNIELTWGLDVLSLNLILLSTFLLLVCYLSYWHIKYKSLYYFFLLNLSLWILINIFSSLDFFYFFLFFELIILPMFFLIGIWGSRTRKIMASYQLFLYTLLGSIFIFISIFDILFSNGNLSFDFFLNAFFLQKRHLIIWLLLFLGFSVKIPIVPLHLWLPEAHVEAPTPGSVILAGLVLKLGSYAILRFLVGSFTYIYYDILFLILLIALFSLSHSSVVALCQIDLKKIIAYSSVAHMNYSLLGLFTKDAMGLVGLYIMIYSHALTSSALFLSIGVLYDRYKTRIIFYYGGLVLYMPIFSIMVFIFILSNFGFPGTFNFIGEFLLTFSIISFSFIIAIVTTFSLVLSLIYSLFFYNKIFFGFVKNIIIRYYNDITRIENLFLLLCVLLLLLNAWIPNIILDNIYFFINNKQIYFI